MGLVEFVTNTVSHKIFALELCQGRASPKHKLLPMAPITDLCTCTVFPLVTPGFRAGQVVLATEDATAPPPAATPGLFDQAGLQQGPTPGFFNLENMGTAGPAVAPSPLSHGGRPPPVQIPRTATASEGTGTGTPGSCAGDQGILVENTAAIRTPKVVRGGKRQRSLLGKPAP